MYKTIYQQATRSNLSQIGKRGVWVNEDALQKVLITGGSGSGKTLMAGRHIVWPLFVWDKVVVVFDPHGTLTDTILWKFLMQPIEWQRKNLHRLKYVNRRPKRDENVVPTPLYYRMSTDDSLASIGRRPLDMFIKSDPSLANAPILGLNQLEIVGTYTGMVCAALGLQITEIPNLLRSPKDWIGTITQAVKTYPELSPALDYFSGLAKIKRPSELEMQTKSFLSKIEPFCLDPVTKAMYGASDQGIDWERAVEEKWLVIYDYRHVTNTQERLFASQVDLGYLLEFIKYRGHGRHTPIYMAIDELAALFPIVGEAAEQMAADLDALINQYARNYRLFLCPLTTQELYQYSHYPKLAKTLLSLNTQFHGVTSDPESARFLAERFFRFDQDWNRRWDPIYMSGLMGSIDIVDWTPVPFSVEEQLELRAQKFLDLQPFQFYARVSQQEGSAQAPLIKANIRDLDRDLYPNSNMASFAREVLSQKSGQPVKDILAEIASRVSKNKSGSNGSVSLEDPYDEGGIPAYEPVDAPIE